MKSDNRDKSNINSNNVFVRLYSLSKIMVKKGREKTLYI